MAATMTAREFAELTGADLEKLEDSIREAEADAITKESMDSSTLHKTNCTPETDEKFRRFMRAAGYHA